MAWLDHKHDSIETIRSVLIPKVGLLVQFIEDVTGANLYVTGETSANQYAATVHMDEDEFERVLTDLGFERNPLASLKQRARMRSDREEGSFRKVGYTNHPRKQLHVLLYDGSKLANAENGVTYVYAHWEYRWDTDPIKHYRGKEIQVEKGVEEMRSLLRSRDIQFSVETPEA